METAKPLLQELEKVAQELSSFSTDLEAEEWILTPEEESAVIKNEVERLAKRNVAKVAKYQFATSTDVKKAALADFEQQIDKPQILRLANSRKLHETWVQGNRLRQNQEELERKQNLTKIWSAQQMLRLMRWTSENIFKTKLIENGNTLPLIKVLCFFLSNESRFETELGYNLNKGLIIRGVSGLGKSFLVECVSGNELRPINIISMVDIADALKENGEYKLHPKGSVLYLDDVGTEPTPIMHYGNKIHWFKDFIELYYNKRRPFNNLMFSTNINFSEIEEKYSHRVRSRMKEMFNVIDVQGNDLRDN